MNIKKPLIIAGAVATIGVAGVTGLGTASAASDTSGSNKLVDKIATKFNLDKSEVEAVFQEEKSEREAERQQKAEERLDKLVAEGKLTEDQKSKILAKHAELRAQMEKGQGSLKDKTKEEMRALMQERQEELKAWAEQQGIPVKYLKLGGGFHQHGEKTLIESKEVESTVNQ